MNQRLQLIRKMDVVKPMSADAKEAFGSFDASWEKIQYVRNTVIHAVIDESGAQPQFHLRSGKRSLSKEGVFGIEELSNYAAHAALAFRTTLGGKNGKRHLLPPMPKVPVFLKCPASKAAVRKVSPAMK